MANQGKCILGKAETKYPGFSVGKGCIQPLANKIEAIRDYSSPQTRKHLRAFPSLASYYWCFIPHFVKVATPLTDFFKGKSSGPIKWDESCLQVFQRMKIAPCLDIVLKTPDFTHPFVLNMDASNQTMGVVLCQEMDRLDQAIFYASCKLNRHEQRYATIE